MTTQSRTDDAVSKPFLSVERPAAEGLKKKKTWVTRGFTVSALINGAVSPRVRVAIWICRHIKIQLKYELILRLWFAFPPTSRQVRRIACSWDNSVLLIQVPLPFLVIPLEL